jgi:hypothetical protein
MNSEEAEIDIGSPTNSKGKVLGVIVLTDNRQTQPKDKSGYSDYRCSAFKGTIHHDVETEIDPLEFVSEGNFFPNDENEIAELSRRVAYL